ncbi:MAG: class I SAM-dependent methyltransferase [Actinobacteria bacterium]|nr:MAG: class I SAM-dependent methyltransferase [Actinomycetota bacterium]TML80454.1 MAG: class I SAM-dependent methyltransferase [Actinomycetota bacterium]
MSHVETPWVVGSRPVRNPVPDLNALKKVVPQALTRFARGHVHWLADPQGRLFLFKMLPRGSVGAEIGVWKGDFSKLLLRRVRPTEFHLIDPWALVTDASYSEARYSKAKQEEMDAMHQSLVETLGRHPGVAIHRESSMEAARRFDDAHFDWVYIDGDHTYEGVRGDLVAWVPKVKAGGLVMCDDYVEGQWFQGGVKRAVDEYVAEKNLPVTIRANQAILKV